MSGIHQPATPRKAAGDTMQAAIQSSLQKRAGGVKQAEQYDRIAAERIRFHHEHGISLLADDVPANRSSSESPTTPNASVSSTDTFTASQSNARAAASPAKIHPITPRVSTTEYGSPQSTRIQGGIDGSPFLGRGQNFASLSSQGQRRLHSNVNHHGTSNGRQMILPTLTDTRGQPQTLEDVPEHLAVQEFGFRRGQQDRGVGRDRIPINPFAPKFNAEWAKAYMAGKTSRTYMAGTNSKRPAGAVAMARSTVSPTPSNPNYQWSPLIDVWTQDPEHPEGTYDEAYTRKMIDSSLDSMASIIAKIADRGRDWDKLVADVPRPVALACQDFPDLAQRYDYLRHAANRAIQGHPPSGY